MPPIGLGNEKKRGREKNGWEFDMGMNGFSKENFLRSSYKTSTGKAEERRVEKKSCCKNKLPSDFTTN